MKRNVIAFVVVTLASFWSSSAAGTPIYHLTPLGYLPGKDDGGAAAISANGEVTGSCDSSLNNTPFAFIWTKSGGIKALPVPAGQVGTAGLSINSNGQVVGDTYVAESFLATTSSAQTMRALTGYNSLAKGINDSGQVVGHVTDFSPTTQAFLWTSSGGLKVLGTLVPGEPSFANAINSSGQVVGFAQVNSSTLHPFIWSSSTGMQDLEPAGSSISAHALAISSNGQVAGTFVGGGGFIWSSSTGMIGLPSAVYASGINASGQVVGYDPLNGPRATRWTKSGGAAYLDSLLDASGSGWQLQYANGINDSGWIVGEGLNPSGKGEAFVLTPLPEPSTLILFTIGGLSMGGAAMRWRRRQPS